jgi:hypothetical protein
MKHLRNWMLGLLMAAGIMSAQAQIGYQICLLNTATGEPRANETVNVTVKLTNNKGDIIYTGDQSATTNDFGILSLTIGNKDTFKDVDLSKLPFWIEVSANGVMIGKSQVLSVPVAEVAKRLAPMDENLILGTWRDTDYYGSITSITFYSNHTGHGSSTSRPQEPWDFQWEIEGNTIYVYGESGFSTYRFMNGKLYLSSKILSKAAQ